MPKSPDSLRQELIDNKDDKSYRHAYADESLNIAIATQIKVLREMREWKQGDLAVHAEMTQPMISRYENVNYSSWSLSTLKKFAWAFDVWLDVRFRSFGELVTSTEEFSRESLQVPKFDDDRFFKEQKAAMVAAGRRQVEGISKAFEGERNVIPIEVGRALMGKAQSTETPIFPPQQKVSASELRLVG